MVSEAVRDATRQASTAHIQPSHPPGTGGAWRTLRRVLVGVDLVSLALATVVATVLRERLDTVGGLTVLNADRHLLAALAAVAILLLLFWSQGLYDFDHILAGTREYARIANAATYGVAITVAISYFAAGNGPLVSRSWLLLVWLLSIASASLARFSMRRAVRSFRARGRLRTRLVVVGASSFGVAIAEQLRAAKMEGLDVVGFLDEYIPLGEPLLEDVRVIGRPSALLSGAGSELADEFVIVPQALPHERLEQLMALTLAPTHPLMRLAVTSADLLTNGVLVAQRGRVPMFTLQGARIVGFDALLKRSLDLLGASVALLALSLPLALTLACARLRGVRGMLRNRTIQIEGGVPATLRLLNRKVSGSVILHGAPALLEVLRGRLSLVGPRPTRQESDTPTSAPAALSTVKPGLTGPWRLSGAEASLEAQIVQDLAYVRNYSVWEDVRILWESLRRALAENRGAGLARWHSTARPEAPA